MSGPYLIHAFPPALRTEWGDSYNQMMSGRNKGHWSVRSRDCDFYVKVWRTRWAGHKGGGKGRGGAHSQARKVSVWDVTSSCGCPLLETSMLMGLDFEDLRDWDSGQLELQVPRFSHQPAAIKLQPTHDIVVTFCTAHSSPTASCTLLSPRP